MNKKILKIIVNAIPVIVMIGLIPVIRNDYLLALADIAIIFVSFFIKRESKDLLFFIFGFFIMLVSETFFVRTGVETFNRHTLFSIMPIWLPVLWGYGFVAIKRSIVILNTKDATSGDL